MSSEVLKFGYIGRLVHPLTDAQASSFREHHSENGFGVNYEGTLVYSVHEAEVYDLCTLPLLGADQFRRAIKALDEGMNLSAVLYYHCVDHNGSDFEVDMMTKEQFSERRGE